MKGAVIYFSGTGNTEFAAKQFKIEFERHNNECALIDIRKKKRINDNYDFFVFGSPIYYGMFPEFFKDWIIGNIVDGRGRRCIVFSTQSDVKEPGVKEITNILAGRDFNVIIQDTLVMPNNYYIEAGRKRTEDEAAVLKENAKIKVSRMVDMFINNEKFLIDISDEEMEAGIKAHEIFNENSGEWAKNNLTIDYDLCVKCGKCAKNCPARNISMQEQIEFNTKCISCQRCIHGCPVNAFFHKGKRIELYRI